MGNKELTIKKIRERTKVERGDKLYSLIDYLAYYPAKLFLHTPLSANQITLIWIIGQIISSIIISKGTYFSMVTGLVLFQLMFILDCTDGIVARFRKQFTLNGIYLDYLGHYINNPLLLICFGIGVSNYFQNKIYFFLGIIAALVFLLNKSITINPCWYKDKKQVEKIKLCYEKSSLQKKGGIVSIIFKFSRLEYLFNLMFFGTVFGYANYVLVIYLIFFTIELLRKITSQLTNNIDLDKQ